MKAPNRKKEKGSALLITLGILSLVQITAMCFAFTSITTRKVAQVNSDQQKARLLAESGMARALAAMQYKANDGSVSQSTPYLPTNTDDNAINFTEYECDSAIISGAAGIKQNMYVTNNPGVSSAESNECKELLGFGSDFKKFNTPIISAIKLGTTKPAFHEIKGSDGSAIGRIAFLILDETDKIDINQTFLMRYGVDDTKSLLPFVKKGEDIFASMAASPAIEDFYYDLLYGQDFDDTVNEKANTTKKVRQGLLLQELTIDNHHTYFNNLCDTNNTGNKTKLPWLSNPHLVASLPPGNNEDLLSLRIFSRAEPETYLDGSSEKDRFDLTSYEWRADAAGDFYKGSGVEDPEHSGWDLGTASAPPEDKNEIALEIVDMLTGTGTDSIDYLHGLGDTGKQIAANMVDFCDSNDFATLPNAFNILDLEGKLDHTTDLDFCGNEQVPYFDEFALEFITIKNSSAIEGAHDYRFIMKTATKLLQIYPFAMGEHTEIPAGKVSVRIKGEFKISTDGGISWDDLIAAGKVDFHFNYLSSTTAPQIYPVHNTENNLLSLSNIPDDTTVMVRFRPTSVTMLSYKDTSPKQPIYDVAIWANDDTTNLVEVNATDEGVNSGYSVTFDWQVKDPRINHRTEDWKLQKEKDMSIATPSASGGITAFDKNDKYNGNPPDVTEKDEEDYEHMNFSSKDETFSTAFIPNRPFRNYWELGAIHRGEPFRTLDIAGVDAEIIDQVKIGPIRERYGFFNPNSKSIPNLGRLVAHIDITKGYEEIADNETATISPPLSLSTELEAKFGGHNDNRSGSAEFFRELAKTEAKNDRQEEALFARTAGLLSTRMEYYSILVAAESLKQLDGVSSTEWGTIKDTILNPIEFRSEYYSILATQKVLMQVAYDSWTKEFKVLSINYLEN